MSEEFKVIRVSLPTYGYLMDHRTLGLKSMDSVIWQLIEDKSGAEAKIKELEATIEEQKAVIEGKQETDYKKIVESHGGQVFNPEEMKPLREPEANRDEK